MTDPGSAHDVPETPRDPRTVVFAEERSPLEATPCLEAATIHVYALSLDPPPAVAAAYETSLSDDERIRADRFRFPRHRRRFVVGRGALRRVLGRYTGTAPSEVRFAYGERGKPTLASDGAPSFNLTNSHELALIAIGRDGPLGVDVEHLRPMRDAESIAERFFSRTERETLRTVPSAEKDRAFFHCWTRKEAYIKAVGDGLAMKLDSFDVTLLPGGPCCFLALGGDREAAAAWTLRHLEPEPGYIGALARPGRGFRVRGWRLPDHRLA